MFTEHQFDLIRKRFTNRRMTPSERNEFSRTVSRKMKAVNKIMEKETGNVFVYGQEKIKAGRLKLAKKYIQRFSRQFKNKHIFITGSFLYENKYNDIDLFVISKYDKEDYKSGKFHINYLPEEVYRSLFFASVNKLCVSNQKISFVEMKEKVDLNTFVPVYQELFNDLDRKFSGVKFILREFLLQAAVISKSPILDSLELKQQINSILKIKKPEEIVKKIFVKTVLLGVLPAKAVKTMKEMISSYQEVMEEYKKFKNYYLNLIEPFEEVLTIAG